MASSAIEDGDQAVEGDYPPGSALHYVEIESELGFAVDRLLEAGASQTGRCSTAEFTQFVGRLRLPENAAPSAIEAMVGRMALLEARFTHELRLRQSRDSQAGFSRSPSVASSERSDGGAFADQHRPRPSRPGPSSTSTGNEDFSGISSQWQDQSGRGIGPMPSSGTGGGRKTLPQDRGIKRPLPEPDTLSGAPFRIADEWPHDVRVFYPQLGKAHASMFSAHAALDSTLRSLLDEQETSPVDAPAHDFEIEFQSALDDIVRGLHSRNPPERKIAATIAIAALSSLLPLRTAVSEASSAIKRAFSLYTLATMTSGASWLTVEQLVYRESFDAQKAQFDPLYQPLVDWDAKVAAALTACRQTNAISKDGGLLGPVAPFVHRALDRKGLGSSGASNAASKPSLPLRGVTRWGSRGRAQPSGARGRGMAFSRGGSAKHRPPRAQPARQLDAGVRGADGPANPP
jgi:hypothetical protein